MSLYKGTDLISGHQVLYSTTGSNTDGAMTQKACADTFANNDLSNLQASASKNLDGQWVASASTIANNVTYPTSTSTEYDISSYLPNDNYNYEVFLTGVASSGSTSGNVVVVRIQTDILNVEDFYLCGVITRTNSIMYADGSAIAPVGTARKIIVVSSSGYVGKYTLHLRGYRRVGTNA